MVRPRWHDALIITALLGLLVVGVWALWWEDVRRVLDLGPAHTEDRAPVQPGQT
jgi:hypothetical protein